MMPNATPLALLAALFSGVDADVYMHTMPGSNNRLDEQNRERANGNRLFDSQNNNRGGYNVGKMMYYQGEEVPIEWTNQHGASKYQMENSELIIQYMCSNIIRDGTTTRTIPIKATECYNYDCDTDVRFGRHESLDNYEMCKKTSRNKGLLTLNQNLKGDAARYTRQNNQGTRHAYECPEERDYYPYWRPTPWIDAVIITADDARCAQYQAESQNVKARGECRMPDAFFDAGGELPNNFYYAITEAACTAQTRTHAGTTYTAEWNIIPAHNVAAPECIKISQTRANHLGNPGGRNPYGLKWTIPETIPDGSQCVTRIRYNITTNDYMAWENGATLEPGADARFNNNKTNPNPNNDPAEYPLWANYGLNRASVQASFNGNNDDSREYVIENNPQVDAFGAISDGFANTNVIKLQLAVNTAQYGRTFQDRSHVFTVMKKPDEIPDDANLILQTVRGKRGNIVQTFPATEYFFTPELSWLRVDDWVHWQWTGSNTNPNNNDGQGKQGTDRSNVVALRTSEYDTAQYSNFEWDMAFEDGQADVGVAGRAYPAYVKNPEGYIIPAQFQKELLTETFGGMDEATLVALATTRKSPHDYGNMEELDDAGTSFNLAPKKLVKQGCTNYLCTRNNNFSNRAQKGKFCVAEGDVGEVMVSAEGQEWWDSRQQTMVMWWPNSVEGMDRAHVIVSNDEPHTATLKISDVNLVGTMTVGVAYTSQSLSKPTLMWQAPCTTRGECKNPWEAVEMRQVELNGGTVAQADVNSIGTFKVVHKPNAGPILALVVAVLAFTLALTWVLIQKCGDKCPGPIQRFQMNRDKNVLPTSVQATGEGGPLPPAFSSGKTEM